MRETGKTKTNTGHRARRRLSTACVYALWALLCWLMMTTACAADAGEKATREFFAMDTYISLSAYGPDAEAGLDAAEEEIHRLEAVLTTESEDSEVGRLNAKGTGVLGEDGIALMRKALMVHDMTDGAFDITVYPLMRLWGFPSKMYYVPTDEEIAEKLPLVGSEQITFDEESGETAFSKTKMAIDFGGIAKGYASAKAVQKLREAGISSALVNLGGNVQALGGKPGGKPFRVAIENPEEDGAYLGILAVTDLAVITSGDYERFFEKDGQIYHHILDPATGRPAESGLHSVTVVCSDGVMADALSTAIFVMGEEKAASFWRENSPAFQMVLLAEDGTLFVTEGLKDVFETDREITWISADE